ncbi:hypothetical protein BH09VER1_BH09VER1_52880 [soil metagenome]
MPRDSKDKFFQGRPRPAELASRDGDTPRAGGSLFVWTIIILLLIGVAISCWIFSFYIFGHPEKAMSYSILTKLKKLEAPKRFEITAAPRGEFLGAKQLWTRYSRMSDRELQRTSEVLLRNYLRNYKLTQDLVPYVVGSYNILDSYELSEKNAVPSGVVALGQSTENPQILLEQIFPADERVVPVLQRMLLTGLDLRLDRAVDLSALINVKRLKDGVIQFTAVPLLYGSYASSAGSGTFSLDPPDHLNISAGFPVLDPNAVEEAQSKLSAYRMRLGLSGGKEKEGDPKKPAAPQLVRVERPKMPDNSVAPTPTPAPTATPALANAHPTEAAPTPVPAALAEVSATPVPDEQPPLQAFTGSNSEPASIANASGGGWPTYSPGQMPRGRLANVPDMDDLAVRGVSGERIYLQGNFVVTAAGQNRAVLRSQSTAENLGVGRNTSKTRVIVEFPSSTRPPAEGSTFSRDSRRPFLITDVRKGADGQVNVYVREVTKAQ